VSEPRTAQQRRVLAVCLGLLYSSIYCELHVADIAGPAGVSDRGCRTILKQLSEEGRFYWKAGRGRGALSRLGRAARPAQKLPVIAAAGASRAIEGVKPQVKTSNPKIKTTVVEERCAHHDRRAEHRHREQQERLRLEGYRRMLGPSGVWSIFEEFGEEGSYDEKTLTSWARIFLHAECPIDPGVADYLADKLLDPAGLTAIPLDARYVSGILQNFAAGQACLPERYQRWPDRPGDPYLSEDDDAWWSIRAARTEAA
jgi:hypothetical protein